MKREFEFNQQYKDRESCTRAAKMFLREPGVIGFTCKERYGKMDIET